MDLKKFFNDFYNSVEFEGEFDEPVECEFEKKARAILERKKLKELQKNISIDFNENINYDEYLKYKKVVINKFILSLRPNLDGTYFVAINELKEDINRVNKMPFIYSKIIDVLRDDRFNKLGLNYSKLSPEETKYIVKFLYKQKDLDIFN
jgi:hypothetical protein